LKEAGLGWDDPDSGSRVWRLTSAPCINHNIYCEMPYLDADSHHLFFLRQYRPYGNCEVWCADMQTHRLYSVCDEIVGLLGIAVSPEQRYFYCTRQRDAGGFTIVRTEMATLDQQRFDVPDLPTPRGLGAVGHDPNRIYYALRVGPQMFGVMRADLPSGTHEVIHEDAQINNAHLQLDPGSGNDLLIQHNLGAKFDAYGNPVALADARGITMYVLHLNSCEITRLPVGEPHTWRIQGHQCWIGTTAEILFTISEGKAGLNDDEVTKRREELIARGCLLAVRPGDEQARVVASGYRLTHPNASRCGRYFVADAWPGTEIVVGSIKTGRQAVLTKAHNSWAGAQYTHVHPYFTPDSRWVVFNSDRTGVPHIHIARVPDELLASLDE
jgi:hypothetical protein